MAHYTIDFDVLGSLKKLKAGRQGTVYSAPDFMDGFSATTAYKEYKKEWLAELDTVALRAMVRFLHELDTSDALKLMKLCAWPERLVERSGLVVGFLMPMVPRAFYLPPNQSNSHDPGLGQIQHLLYFDQDQQVKRGIRASQRDLLQILYSVASALDFLHSHGIAVGDLSPNNLCFSLNPSARVYFIDADAMSLRRQSALPQLESPDWGVRAIPSDEELGTSSTDCYKLALLTLRLLSRKQNSRSASDIPASVPRPIRLLAKKALSGRPKSRPRARDWMAPLKKAIAVADSTKPSLAMSTPSSGGSVRSPKPVKAAPTPVQAARAAPAAKSTTVPSKVAGATNKASVRRKVSLVKKVVMAFSGAVLVGGKWGVGAILALIVPAWIYDLSTGGRDISVIVQTVVVVAVVIGSVYGARSGWIGAGKASWFVPAISLMVIGAAGWLYFHFAQEAASERAFERFRFGGLVIAEDLSRIEASPVGTARAFVGPRRGIAFKASYSNAVPETTEFAMKLYSENRGRYRFIAGCSEKAGASPTGSVICNLQATQLPIGNYIFVASAKTGGQQKDVRPTFMIRNRDGVLAARVQQGLKRLGYNVGSVDGVAGPNTAAAIMQFQRDRSLPITGKTTEQLASLLESSASTAGASNRALRNSGKRTPFSLVPSGTQILLDIQAKSFCTRPCDWNRSGRVWIRPMSVWVRRSSIEVHFSAENPSDTRNFLIFPDVDSLGYSERLHLVDKQGRKYYAIDGIEGLASERFNNKARMARIGPTSSVVFFVRFPKPGSGVDEVTFISPRIHGHQSEWSFSQIVSRTRSEVSYQQDRDVQQSARMFEQRHAGILSFP